jgi:hypothetical protein
MGQGLGQALGKASDLYLQNKVQGYFDEQKEARQAQVRQQSATGLAKASKHPEWAETLSSYDAPEQIKVAQYLGTQIPQNSLLDTLINKGRFKVPEQATQPAPTPPTVAANTAAAQRIGATGQPTQIPGMPAYAQPATMGQPQNLPMMQPQYQQQAMAQQPTLPGGQVPPEPVQPQGTGLDLASFQGKNLGEMTDEQVEALKQGQTPEKQAALQKTRDQMQSASRGERQAIVAEETLKFRKSEAEKARKERTIEKETKDSSKFLKDIDAETEPLILEEGQLNEAKKAIESGDVGSLTTYLADKFKINPLLPANAARFKTASKNAYVNTIRSTGNRPNQWLEQTIYDATAQIGRKTSSNMISIEQAIAEHDVKMAKVNKANELRKKYMNDPDYGYVPAKIAQEVSDYQKEFASHRFDMLSYRTQQILENEKKDGTLLGQGRVSSGTPLTIRMFDILKKKNGGNVKNTIKEAHSLGYQELPEQVYAEQK